MCMYKKFFKPKFSEKIEKIITWLNEQGHTAIAKLIERQQSVMPDIQKTLDKFGIDNCFIGGSVLPFYNHPVTTSDVDILVSGDKEGEINKSIRKKYMHKVEGTDGIPKWYWKDSTVEVGFVYSNRVYNRGGIAFPDPKKISELHNGLRVITLPQLILHKLDSGRSSVRQKDIGHVNSLIQANNLPKEYAKINKFPLGLRRDYERQWLRLHDENNITNI